MAIKGVNPIPMFDDDRLAVPILPAGKDDRARRSYPARRFGLCADVDAAVKAPKRAARPEIGGDRTTHGQARPQRGNRRVPRADRGVVADHMPPLRSVITRHAAADGLRGGTTSRDDPLLLTRRRDGRRPDEKNERERYGRARCEPSHVTVASNWCASTRYRSKVYERSDRARTWRFRQGTFYRLRDESTRIFLLVASSRMEGRVKRDGHRCPAVLSSSQRWPRGTREKETNGSAFIGSTPIGVTRANGLAGVRWESVSSRSCTMGRSLRLPRR